MRSAPITLAALITAIGFAGCSADAEVSIGGTSIDTDEAEQQISSGLADAYGDPPKTLTCPDDVDAVEGETFVCEGRSPDPESQPFEIEVTMTDDEGGIRYPTQVTFTGGANPQS